MRKISLFLASLLIAFSSASVASQSTFNWHGHDKSMKDSISNGFEQRVSNFVEMQLNTPAMKQKIADRANVNVNEIGHISVSNIDVKSVKKNSENSLELNIQANCSETGIIPQFICELRVLLSDCSLLPSTQTCAWALIVLEWFFPITA